MKQLLGIDIGGTNIKIATVAPDDGTVIRRGLIETSASEGAARAFKRIHAAARSLGSDGIDAVGIGCAGLFDERRGVLTASPNLKEWEHAPLARIASRTFSVPILIQNDASCAAYGEAAVRRARGRDLILITLGTGVGGGIVMDGHLVRGANGYGGEIGHISVDPDGPLCRCGSRGCLEAFAGSYGIVRAARAHGGPKGRLTAWDVTLAAREGKLWAKAAIREAGTALGIAIGILLNTLNPSVIVLGGGGAGGFDLLEPHVRRALVRHAFRETITAARIERARLGNDD
ncbi:MAG TPA: ROK family protein, partial [Candidatus Krumholzibacteria bacterium]